MPPPSCRFDSGESWWNLLRSDQVHSQMSESNTQRVKAQLSQALNPFPVSETWRLQELFAEFSAARRKGAGPEARRTPLAIFPVLHKSCRPRASNKTVALRCRGLCKQNRAYFAQDAPPPPPPRAPCFACPSKATGCADFHRLPDCLGGCSSHGGSHERRRRVQTAMSDFISECCFR